MLATKKYSWMKRTRFIEPYIFSKLLSTETDHKYCFNNVSNFFGIEWENLFSSVDILNLCVNKANNQKLYLRAFIHMKRIELHYSSDSDGSGAYYLNIFLRLIKVLINILSECKYP